MQSLWKTIWGVVKITAITFDFVSERTIGLSAILLLELRNVQIDAFVCVCGLALSNLHVPQYLAGTKRSSGCKNKQQIGDRNVLPEQGDSILSKPGTRDSCNRQKSQAHHDKSYAMLSYYTTEYLHIWITMTIKASEYDPSIANRQTTIHNTVNIILNNSLPRDAP